MIDAAPAILKDFGLANISGVDFNTDPGACLLAGQDIFPPSDPQPVLAIAHPHDTAAVAALIAAARSQRLLLAPRGAGLSYTGAYASPDPTRTVVVDTTGLAAIREINPVDRFVLVEAGCTWAALDTALAAHGMAAAFAGPVSGRLATVGGSLSMNGAFWGSARSGAAADAVLGLEVVTGAGDVIRTGSLGTAGCNAFTRHAGPDLAGLFLGDCGSFGIKTTAALRLVPALPADSLAFTATDPSVLFGFLADVGGAGLATHCMALDATLQSERVAGTTAGEAAGQLRAIAAAQGSATDKVRGLAALARTGMHARLRRPARGFVVHIGIEAADAAALAMRAAQVAAVATRYGLATADATVGRAMLRQKFGPVTGLAGSKGERWVPVHGLLPHSRAAAAFAAVHAILDGHADAMAAHDIKVRNLIASVGPGAVIVEPMFLWPDALPLLARATLASETGHKPSIATAGPPLGAAATALVTSLRAQLIAVFDSHGASHFQLGTAYPWRQRLGPSAFALHQGLRALLDPDHVLAAPLFAGAP